MKEFIKYWYEQIELRIKHEDNDMDGDVYIHWNFSKFKDKK